MANEIEAKAAAALKEKIAAAIEAYQQEIRAGVGGMSITTIDITCADDPFPHYLLSEISVDVRR